MRPVNPEAIWNDEEPFVRTCRACGTVYEGTSTFTLQHWNKCKAVSVYYQLKGSLGQEEAFKRAMAAYGKPLSAP